MEFTTQVETWIRWKQPGGDSSVVLPVSKIVSVVDRGHDGTGNTVEFTMVNGTKLQCCGTTQEFFEQLRG